MSSFFEMLCTVYRGNLFNSTLAYGGSSQQCLLGPCESVNLKTTWQDVMHPSPEIALYSLNLTSSTAWRRQPSNLPLFSAIQYNSPSPMALKECATIYYGFVISAFLAHRGLWRLELRMLLPRSLNGASNARVWRLRKSSRLLNMHFLRVQCTDGAPSSHKERRSAVGFLGTIPLNC